MSKEVLEFVQIGSMMIRNPDGSINPAMPIYEQVTEENRQSFINAENRIMNFAVSECMKKFNKERNQK